MSKEVAIFATIQPAPSKADRFKEATKNAMDWIEENEPDTLQFEMYEEESPEGIKICLFERYASQEAMERHRSSDSYKKFFETVMAEELIAGPPQISTCKYVSAIRR
ncbi:hypothetical protein LTR37_008924 [Vermiconidia calcicola]|uniref:Uncharacterized protein n=1 Tax=Vermiconidia calcicola TaxID=1690605 RepID=A0ACC3N9D4_9PEZI|nr:hypothetical protein LTR37_008924 [Vermiconidia calcicola]